MKILIMLFGVSLGLLFHSCASMQPIGDNVPMEFTYDFTVPEKSKSELWKSARDFFAGAFGDSRSVMRVMDEEAGTLIGKGVATWNLMTSVCATGYHIRFAAKDGKARLQFELMEGVPSESKCSGWPLPSESGYEEIINHFDAAAESLESALKGEHPDSDFYKF